MLFFGDRAALLKSEDNDAGNVADRSFNPSDKFVELFRNTPSSSINEGGGSVVRSTSTNVV